jgi:hypothetical protein
MADWIELVKVLGASVGALGLAGVTVWDRWKGTEIKGKDAQLVAKDEQIRVLERHVSLLEAFNSKALTEGYKDLKEGLERVVADLKAKQAEKEEQLKEKDRSVARLQQLLDNSQSETVGLNDALQTVIWDLSEERDALKQELENRQKELLEVRTFANGAIQANHTDRGVEGGIPAVAIGALGSGLSSGAAAALVSLITLAFCAERIKESEHAAGSSSVEERHAWSEGLKLPYPASEAAAVANGSGEQEPVK